MARKKSIDSLVSENTESPSGFNFLNELTAELEKDKNFKFSKYDGISIKKSTGFDIIDAVMASNKDNRGLQLRHFHAFYGNSGSGKSTLVLQIAYNIVKDTNGFIVYFDTEKTLTEDRIVKLGVDPEKVKIINQNTTLENFYRLGNKIASVREKEIEANGIDYVMENPIILIIDSINSATTEREIGSDTNIDSAMGVAAKLNSVLLKQLCEHLFSYNITVLAVRQSRDKIDIGPIKKAKSLIYQKADVALSGGKSVEFYSFYHASLWSKKVVTETIGKDAIEVELNLEKSKSSVTNKPVRLIFLPLHGYSNLWSNYKMLIDNNVIKIAGAYKSLPGYEKKFYTKDLENLYETNEEFRLAFDAAVKETLQQYIDSIPIIQENSLESLIDDSENIFSDDTFSQAEEYSPEE